MSPQIVRFMSLLLKYGLLVLPVMSLIITDSLIYPFITGKNFFFRIGMEVLFPFWVLTAVFDKNYRPKKSPILGALATFLLILILATIFGEDPYRSFWSSYERMEGLVSHLHLFAYFLILTSVFKKEKDFKLFFVVFLGISAIVSIYSYLELAGKVPVRPGGTILDATLGNSTYLAIYILFHLFIIGWLFLKTSNKWLRASLVFLFSFELPIIYYTTTRGAILGLVGGVMIFVLSASILSKKRKARFVAVAFFGILFLAIALFMSFRDSSFVRKSATLEKIASISLTEGSVETRLTVWKMSWEAFREHPILGWGPENFDLVFYKYYKPNLGTKEPWFDRAHNVVFDWLIFAGLLGLAGYLAIFISGFYILWDGYKKKCFGWAEASLFTGLLVAYSLHNLFVFDNIVSYFLFFTVLGYIHCRYLTNNSRLSIKGQTLDSNGQFKQSRYVTTSLVFIGIIFSLYFVNIKPLLAARQFVNTLKDISQKGQDVDLILNDFEKVFGYRTFGIGEARQQLADYANYIFALDLPEKSKLKTFQIAIDEMEKQVKSHPGNIQNYVALGSLYIRFGKFDDAWTVLNKALELSPKKQQIWFVIADLYWSTGQNEKAMAVLKETYELDPRFEEAVRHLAVLAILNNQGEYAEDLLEKNFKKGIIAEEDLIDVYVRVGNYEKVRQIWQLLIEKEPNNAQYYVNLATTYLKLNRREEAVKSLEKAIELNPQFKFEGQFFINEIRAGRNL